MIRRGRSLCLRLGAVLLIACFGWVVPAQAKMVAIVFDTSGSMHDRYRLPTFGMQLLAGTIDGRGGGDRLLTMTFDEYVGAGLPSVPLPGDRTQIIARANGFINAHTVRDERGHQGLVNQLGPKFAFTKDLGTPYGPIEVMLDRISAEVAQGEEIYLVVVSDGQYAEETDFAQQRLVPQMREVYQDIRARLDRKSANLSVEYLFIDKVGGSSLQQTVADQGVRDTLIEVFNDGITLPNGKLRGDWYVDSAAALWEALQDIVARVSATDRQASQQLVTYKGNVATINSPLSISRIIAVSTASGEDAPAEVNSAQLSSAAGESRRIAAAMSRGDDAFAGARRNGVVQHYWFQDALTAGRREITFDASVEDGVIVLFETQAVSDLVVRDVASGALVPAGADGSYRLFKDQAYRFEAQVLDGAGTPSPVEFNAIGKSLSVTLGATGATGPPPVSSMEIDWSGNLASLDWTPTQAGETIVKSRAMFSGMTLPDSDGLRLRVVDPGVGLSVSGLSSVEPCPECGPDDIGSTIFPGQGNVEIGRLELRSEAEIGGQILLNDSVLPSFIELRDAQGQPLNLDQPIDMAKDEVRGFTIWRKGTLGLSEVIDGVADVELHVKPAGDWVGAGTKAVIGVRLRAPALDMVLVSVSQPLTSGALDGLRVPEAELLRGGFRAQYRLNDLIAPPDPEQADTLVSVTYQGALAWLLDYTVSFSDAAQTGGHGFDLAPSSKFWCLCWFGVSNWVTGSDTRNLEVRYTGPGEIQAASDTLALSLPVRPRQMGLSCALNAFYLLLLCMFLRGLLALFTTNRFPAGAVAEITDGKNAPSFKRLDRKNSVWWKAWFALFLGNPDEVRVIEGVRVRSVPGGGMVDVRKSSPPWGIESKGETFEDLKARRPNLSEVKIGWGERLESLARPSLSVRLKKRTSEH